MKRTEPYAIHSIFFDCAPFSVNSGDGRPHNVRNYATNPNPWYAVDDGTKRRLLDVPAFGGR